MNTEITEECGGWVLYDGDCAICRAWVARFYRVLRRRGFKFAALQAPWVRTRFGMKPDSLLVEMRLVTADGWMLGGADALIEIARTIWWAWPVYALSRVPGVLRVMRKGYCWLAARRHCVSGACGFRNRPSHAQDHRVTSAFYEWP